MGINQILNYKLVNNFLHVYAIWLREFKVYLRERSRIVGSLFTPLLWLFIVGSGIGSSTTLSIDVNYQKFIFPGIISMSIIFTSVFYGAYIIWDRKFDFLKSVMVAPISRETIFIGKTLGGMTNSMIQVFMLLIIGLFIGIEYSLCFNIADSFCFCYIVIFTYCFGFRAWKSNAQFRRIPDDRNICCISFILFKWSAISFR